MSKELESLEYVKNHDIWTFAGIHGWNTVDEKLVESFKIIKKTLEKLERIESKQTNEELEKIVKYFENDSVLAMVCVSEHIKESEYRENLNILKQSLEELETIKKLPTCDDPATNTLNKILELLKIEDIDFDTACLLLCGLLDDLYDKGKEDNNDR